MFNFIFCMFEMSVSVMFQITLVGLVRAVKESPTRFDYEIDDMTGPPIEVKQFVDNDVRRVSIKTFFSIIWVLPTRAPRLV